MKKVETVKTKLGRLLNGLGRVLSFSAVLLMAYGLWPMALHAEVPVKFTYQGNLRQSGFLVNGQRPMIFRIYDSSSSATVLWTSPSYNVSLSTGVFRVTLEPVIADWQSGSLWLELEVAGNRMSPREELTSSPYAINSLMLSGKRYTSAAAPPTGYAAGDLWYNTSGSGVSFWNGSAWMSVSSTPGLHRDTHAGGGTDPIISLGTLTVTGALTLQGILNPSANLNIGGSGYSVVFASSVTAGWFSGNGFGLYSLDASKITAGLISGDRIGNVIVSTHIVDGSIQNQDLAAGAITLDKLNQSGCSSGQLLQWDGSGWVCGNPAAVVEVDPLSILKGDMLQPTTFYVSSGTVNNLNINNLLKVMGPALLKGAPGQQGLSVEATGNVGIGLTGASARLEVRGADTQNYSLAIGTGTAHQVVVSTSGAVGIGTGTPRARMEVTGAQNPGEYIMIFNSGNRTAAWLRNK